MSDFERAYQSYLKTYEERGHLFNEVLGKLAMLAGEVYDPRKDKDMDEELDALSRHVFILEMLDGLHHSFMSARHDQTHNQNTLQFEVYLKEELKKKSPNYSRILGWVKTKAEERCLYLAAMPGEREKGLNEIRDFTVDAESLIVIDPYLFSGPSNSATKIAQDFSHCARLDENDNQLQVISIIHGRSVTNAVKSAILGTASGSLRFNVKESDVFHDRVWIADGDRGLVIGTSLNGIGRRASFLLPLPAEDLKSILTYIDEKCILDTGI